MPTIVARHKVGDIDTWLKGHQDRINLFAPAVSSFKTFQDTDDPNVDCFDLLHLINSNHLY